MNNKVVYTLYHAFVQRGFSALRFNFRGVGRSQGIFDRGEGELADAAAALDWLQSYNPNATACWIGGFSFGAWIGMQLLMRRPEIDGFIAVAPPANMFDFSFLAPCPASGLIIQGDQDQLVPLEAVQRLVTKLMHQRDIQIDYRVIAGRRPFLPRATSSSWPRRRQYIASNQRTKASAVARSNPSHKTPASPDRDRRSSGAVLNPRTGSRTSTVSSRSGLVESSATGASISSSMRRMYLIAERRQLGPGAGAARALAPAFDRLVDRLDLGLGVGRRRADGRASRRRSDSRCRP